MYESEVAHSLLVEATEKLIELQKESEWNEWGKELPPRFPPIPWTGNARSEKPVVLTVSGNPSRAEFLNDDRRPAIKKVEQSGDFSTLSYKTPSEQGIRLLRKDESLEELHSNEELQSRQLRSANEYFQGDNYYEEWFGKPGGNSFNTEGFLYGFGASYFESEDKRRRAVHIDLFPFATMEDFGELPKRLMRRDLFENEWAIDHLRKLIDFFDPEALIVFGITNVKRFRKYVDSSLPLPETRYNEDGANTKYALGKSEQFGVPAVCISTNLGGYAFTASLGASELQKYGAFIRKELENRKT